MTTNPTEPTTDGDCGPECCCPDCFCAHPFAYVNNPITGEMACESCDSVYFEEEEEPPVCGHGWIGDNGQCGGYDAKAGSGGVGCGRYFDMRTGVEVPAPVVPSRA